MRFSVCRLERQELCTVIYVFFLIFFLCFFFFKCKVQSQRSNYTSCFKAAISKLSFANCSSSFLELRLLLPPAWLQKRQLFTWSYVNKKKNKVRKIEIKVDRAVLLWIVQLRDISQLYIVFMLQVEGSMVTFFLKKSLKCLAITYRTRL